MVVCGYALLFVACIAAWVLFLYLANMFLQFFFPQVSSEPAIELILNILSLVMLAVFLGIYILCSIFTEKVTSSYRSFKNENGDYDAFSEVYHDPTISVRDKILLFSIYLIYWIQLPFLYCTLKILAVNSLLQGWKDEGFSLPLQACFILINAILLIPVALLELIKYPLIKLFSPLGWNVKQLSFLFNVSDVGTGSQSVHTRSFEKSTIKCAKELKEKYGTPSNELDEEFKSYINGLTSEQKYWIEPYLRLDDYEIGKWVNWVDSRTGLTPTQAINLVLIAAREQNADVEHLKVTLLVRFRESKRKCGPGMLIRIIYALSSLEAKNNFAALLEPRSIGKLAGNATKRFFERYMDKHYYKIKVLKENFDDLYSPGSEVDLSSVSDEVKDGISYTRDAIKEFVFKELYVMFYNGYGKKGIRRSEIKQKLRELITNEIVDAAIYSEIDEIEIPPEPPTYLEKVKTFFGGHARSSAA
ncbi:hypothetical protein [Wolbachia endosymbiont (group A) of Trypoxylon clavicerum]|uniref:hypothetical protein n=1 Tax=Wolbachia endosymbiont (group A) of Trypoxylon clavicerum TaxID=2954064 RepID=UPI0022319343|nr:hypothetical protein [Wolbachia endosymbiont (group A) of Trypoxylon clavicerum]